MKKMIYVLTILVFANLAFAQQVTFKVNMSVKAKKGQFRPGTDTVSVSGSFNGWNTTADILTENTADTTYSITKTFNTNDTLQFKFVATGSLGGYEGGDNRSLIVQAGSQTYTAYYNNDSVYSAPRHIQLTFNANMEFEIASGRFNTTRPDTLTIRGDFNGWGGSTVLSPGTLDPNTYTGIFDDTLSVGETLNMKLAYITAGGVTWETGGNRTYTITQSDYDNGIAVISRTFNDLTVTEITNAPCTITFNVDMTNAVSSITGQPFASIDNVVMAGANAPFQWPTGGWPNTDSALVLKMYNDGNIAEHGDTVANDKIWSRKVTFPIFSPFYIEYKYGANWGLPSNTGGNDNESSVGTNHWVRLSYRMISGSVRNVWSVMDTVNPGNQVLGVREIGSGVPESYNLSQNYPNPFNPTTNIRFNIPQSGLVTLKIYNVLGQEVATLLNEFKNAGSYQYTFDASKLNSGVYFYTITSNNYTSTKKMTLVK